MDPFNVTVAGSRYPISVPAVIQPVKPLVKAVSPQTTLPSTLSSQSSAPSKIRRKPVQTYKSPTVNDGFRIDNENAAQRIPPSLSSSSHTSSSKSDAADRASLNLRRQQPSLPLYHPLGRLAQSLPALDPRIFGLQHSVSIDDNDMQLDDTDSRRPVGRSRKPAAKARDRDQEEGDDPVSVNGASGANGTAAEREGRSTTSPRKRRAVAGGAAGGPKRRKKDVDDGTFPQPARRTRNPRGVAAASPLAGVAIAAEVPGEDGGSPAPTDAPDLQTAVLQAQEARPVRSTRSRAPVKRRDSSASSGTSVSVSIAIHAQQTRTVEILTAVAASNDVEMKDEVPTTEESTRPASERKDETNQEPVRATADVDTAAQAASKPEIVEATATVDEPAVDKPAVSRPKSKSPTPPPVSRPEPEPAPTTAQEKPVAKPVEKVDSKIVEEKEEGELSDGPA